MDRITYILVSCHHLAIHPYIPVKGNADPKQNWMTAGLAGVALFIVLILFIKFVLNW